MTQKEYLSNLYAEGFINGFKAALDAMTQMYASLDKEMIAKNFCEVMDEAAKHAKKIPIVVVPPLAELKTEKPS